MLLRDENARPTLSQILNHKYFNAVEGEITVVALEQLKNETSWKVHFDAQGYFMLSKITMLDLPSK